MIAMFQAKRYHWALFVVHLVIEKLLKAYYVQENEDFPPFVHNLIRLAEKSNMKLTDKETIYPATVTAFNINARYDDYKMSFQKKCTSDFTTQWIHNLKEM